jgi:hypothetical protein
MLNFCMTFGVLERWPQFEADVAPLLKRPAALHAREQNQALVTQGA